MKVVVVPQNEAPFMKEVSDKIKPKEVVSGSIDAYSLFIDLM